MNGTDIITMKMGVLHVNSTIKPPKRLRITIRSPWLLSFGFAYDLPAVAIPQQNGFTFILQNGKNTNIAPGDGVLVHVGNSTKKPLITLNFSKVFSTAVTGLSAGDFLAVKYEHGIITARKLPSAHKYYVVTVHNHDPFLRVTGDWLSDAGFPPDTIVTVSVSPARACITLYAWKGATADYYGMVKFARQQKYHIIQTRKNQHLTVLDLPGYILEHAGFCAGDILGVRFKHGVITLFKPDLSTLGF